MRKVVSDFTRNRIFAAFMAVALVVILGVPATFAVQTATSVGSESDVVDVDAEALSTAVNEPFTSNTPIMLPGYTEPVYSNSYRIPAMVTLSDGTIVAAADIRWNTTYDGGGLDTLVARSADGGVTWDYTVANYLGDNGNTYNSESTAFLDPCLTVAADGKTVYMLTTFYPYGVALNGKTAEGNDLPQPKAGTNGFDASGNLLLSSNNHWTYDYYLNMSDYKIYTSGGELVEGYQVDSKFNLTYMQNGATVTSNLFFENSPYKVTRTGYLYLVSSSNGGASWSEPVLLNIPRESASEQATLVAPGRGITTSNDVMIIPVYSFHGGNNVSGNTQRMSFLYSTDGVNWKRSAAYETGYNKDWSSESAVVELTDGTLRFFYRNGNARLCYVDYSDGAWGNHVVMNDVVVNSNTQLSAITYSETTNGSQIILVSCPTGPNGAGSTGTGPDFRQNGSIFAFAVTQDNGLSLIKKTSINSNNSEFFYSCLTERLDGTIAVLYENKQLGWGYGTGCSYTMDLKVYTAADLGLDSDSSFIKPVDYTAVAPLVEPVVGSPEEGVDSIDGLIHEMTSLDDAAGTPSALADTEGLVTSKTVASYKEGEYEITLETYATGSKVTTTVEEEIPADIILVLDQSISMQYCLEHGDGSNVGHQVITYAYDPINNPPTGVNYWYMKSDGSYAEAYYCNSFSGGSSHSGWYTESHRSGYFGHTDAGQKLAPKTGLNDADTSHVQFYEGRETGRTTCTSESRLDALKEVAGKFVADVSAKAMGDPDVSTDDVHHRIAVVGFGNETTDTEILSVAWGSGVGVPYLSVNSDHYKAALQDVATSDGQTMVNRAVAALSRQGYTRTDLGLKLAEGIFANNGLEGNEKRSRVVVVFTDGTPTEVQTYHEGVANAAISYSHTLKNTYGATVYTVGVFSGADASGDIPVYDKNATPERENRFMHLMSSNYPDAIDMNTPGNRVDLGRDEQNNPKSYYLSASNSAALNEIFSKIQDQVQTGGATISLGSETVVKDVVSRYFALPEKASASSIKVFTAECDGVDAFGAYTWKEPVAYGASVKLEGKTVEVTNFDFSANWVGTEKEVVGGEQQTKYRGKKLIVKFSVLPEEEFFGGNGVPTNETSSGVYKDAAAADKGTPVEQYQVPTANVQLKTPTITGIDRNIYLYGEVPKASDLVSVVWPVGEEAEKWAFDFVESSVQGGESVSNVEDTTDITVIARPTLPGTGSAGMPAEAIELSEIADVHVYKPYLTFKDSSVYYGETMLDLEKTYVLGDDSGFVSLKWKRGSTDSKSVEMFGTAPTVACVYTSDPVAGALVSTTEDIPVEVAVTVAGKDAAQHTTFLHTPCANETAIDEHGASDNKFNEFWVHVKTCSLAIAKTGSQDANQSFVFNVKTNAGSPISIEKTVAVIGNDKTVITGLPVGSYTVVEDQNWSWRYDAVAATKTVELVGNSEGSSVTVSFQNKLERSLWLDFSGWCENLFTGNGVYDGFGVGTVSGSAKKAS